jgi:RNA recognition motif-containing protein
MPRIAPSQPLGLEYKLSRLGKPTRSIEPPRERNLERRMRAMKLYVSNLPYNTTEESLHKLFSRHGYVQAIWIGNTRVGSAHGYGFVLMPDGPSAEKAISVLDGLSFEGSEISVHRARD